MLLMLAAVTLKAKTLIVYYSFTNNVATIVENLQQQIDADVVEVLPTEENVDYAANNYAIGSALIAAIRNNPDDEASYPSIRTTIDNLDDYDMIIIATPLWWSNMAAPMQTFLFRYGAQMSGKNVGLIVSSASSGISGVVSDAKRLVPEGNFLEPNLWIRSSQTANSASLLSDWLEDIRYEDVTTAIEGTVGTRGDVEVAQRGGALQIGGAFDAATLYGLDGREVLRTAEAQIPTSSLRSGVYLLSVRTATGSQTHKVRIAN